MNSLNAFALFVAFMLSPLMRVLGIRIRGEST